MSDIKITEGQCILVIEGIRMMSIVVRDMPLEEFIREANLEETIGPIFDPTGFRNDMGKIAMYKNLAQALLEFKKAVLKEAPNAGLDQGNSGEV